MEKTQIKPIHFRCPKCGYDFSYNSSYVERNIDKLKREIKDIDSQITYFNEQHPNPKERKTNKWYISACRAKTEKIKQLAELKQNRKVAMQEAKLQTFEIFKRKVSDEIGKERFLTLIQEAESELVYNLYDNAKQNFTNFENI